MSIMNEHGNSTLMGISFLILFTIAGLRFTESRIYSFKKIRQKQNILLCSKKINGEYSRFITKIELTNQMLRAATLGKTFALLIPIPGLNIALKQSGEVMIKLLKIAQNMMFVSLLKNVPKFYMQGCLISPSFAKTPYHYTVKGFSRNALNEIRSRGKKEWVIYVLKGKYRIKSIFNIPTGKVSSKIKTGIFSSISPSS